MIPNVPIVPTPDMHRRFGGAINHLLNLIGGGHPFVELLSAPSNPTEGRTYYDLTTHKVRTWDGAAWQNHW